MLTFTCLLATILGVVGLNTVKDTAQGSLQVDRQSLQAGQQSLPPDGQATLEKKWGFNWGYSGISTFAHLPHVSCLTNPDHQFDIGIIGVPFDTTVSYRPGARFGPRSIRAASARHLFNRAFNTYAGVNPYQSWARVIDCGDVPVIPFDNAVAVKQMTEAFLELGSHSTPRGSGLKAPKLVTLGGDHLVALPALRALRQIHGQPMALLHFDAHLDTLQPSTFPSAWESETSQINHGSVFWHATNEGLLRNGSCVHAGINTRLTGTTWDDYIQDDHQGFLRISVDAIDQVGAQGIIDMITSRMGEEMPVYMSVDIDVLDPAHAPGTGAPEPGGWTTRELMKIIRGVNKLNVVGVDIVEVAPAYDTPGSDTAFVAAGLAYEIITNLVKLGDGATNQNIGIPRSAKPDIL